MNAARASTVRPFLLEGSRGPVAACYYPAAASATPRPDVLVVPAFAEEMNRCRAMVAMQARSLSSLGIGTLVVDPYGTGDSGGSFCDATWETWLDDLRLGVEWLRRHGNGCKALWGIRLGAIAAAELATGDPGIERLLLWQPVLSGKTYFTQFLRIRIAADLELPDGVKTTDELRRRAAAGEFIDVSGYRIGPGLAAALDRVAFPTAGRLDALQIDWLEVLASADAEIPRASSRAVEEMRAAGVRLDLQSVVGPPFWQVHEREVAPDLISATAESVSRWVQPSSSHHVPRGDVAASDEAECDERPVVFACGEDDLVGVLHASRRPAPARGVVIVVAGGPQYRAGAHRQFVSLARKLSEAGYPVLRFDLRGMGDSSGTYVGFQQSGPDIRAAIDALLRLEPRLEDVVLFGECESASGILFYAWSDPRVKGIALVNPWVRTEEGRAQVIIKHYYFDRLRSPEFWKSVREGRFNVLRSLASLGEVLRAYVRGRRLMSRAGASANDEDLSGLPLPLKTASGLRRFGGRVMLLMSGRDYIAREFDEVTAASAAWRGLLESPRIWRRDLAEADHTFSREPAKSQASDSVLQWLGTW